jgi:N-acetylglutamate synthase-like GNAT family acetyltransferase
VRNDGKSVTALRLRALAPIFAAQLPTMPREYVDALLFEPEHESLAVFDAVSDEIIGGVCSRPRLAQRFAEIALLVVTGSRQAQGVGSAIIGRLKQIGKETGIEQLLTYADERAIVFFEKQGFSRHVTLPRERWAGLINEYNGGTLLECSVHAPLHAIGRAASPTPPAQFANCTNIGPAFRAEAERNLQRHRFYDPSQHHHLLSSPIFALSGAAAVAAAAQFADCTSNGPGLRAEGWGNLPRHHFYDPSQRLSPPIFAPPVATGVAAVTVDGGGPQQAETLGWLNGRRQPAELGLGGYPSEGRMAALASQSADARASLGGPMPGAGGTRGGGRAVHSLQSIVPDASRASLGTRPLPSTPKPIPAFCVCTEPGCGQRFSAQRHLDSHISVIHRGEQKYVCPEPGCRQAFSYRNQLVAHKRDAHADPSYPCRCLCRGCSAAFATEEELREHKKNRHTRGQRPAVRLRKP